LSNIPPLDLVPMGKLLQPWGISGELRLTIFNELDSTLKIGMEIWMESTKRVQFSYIIESLNISGSKSLIKFAGCNECVDANNLSGLIFFTFKE